MVPRKTLNRGLIVGRTLSLMRHCSIFIPPLTLTLLIACDLRPHISSRSRLLFTADKTQRCCYDDNVVVMMSPDKRHPSLKTNVSFLDAFSHLNTRVCPSVRSVTHELKSCKSAVLTKIIGSTSENASYAVYTAFKKFFSPPLPLNF